MNLATAAKNWLSRPPLALVLIGAAHLVWLFWSIAQVIAQPHLSYSWVQAAWLLLYSAFWLAACSLRKWGVFGYTALVLVDIALLLLVKDTVTRAIYVSNLAVIDAVFSIVLLLYFKRFR